MTDTIYYVVSAILIMAVLVGIYMMSRVKTAKLGNSISAIATLVAIIVTLSYMEVFNGDSYKMLGWILLFLLIGTFIGIWITVKVKMIQLPQLVAILNGLGGAASTIVGAVTMFTAQPQSFELFTAILAVIIGIITFVGSLIAALKLSGIIDGRPVVFPYHQVITIMNLILVIACFLPPLIIEGSIGWILLLLIIFGSSFAYFSTIRISGADMPITISLLNSLSGVAAAIAGMAISDILLVAVGGIVGASGLILTQIMCRSMNRHLLDILLGKTSLSKREGKPEAIQTIQNIERTKSSLSNLVTKAKHVIIVPGYGMALSQAQHLLKQVSDQFKANGADVKFAIHPVAGRMPGHMNVLLAEADVDYEELYEMDAINDQFKDTDLVLVVGANDVVNPAARFAEGTPIYGMPVLNVDEAKHVVICNYDLKPGYSGVDNPLYQQKERVTLLLGDAKESLSQIIDAFQKDKLENPVSEQSLKDALNQAKTVIIVPGYGMALSQAQHLLKQVSDQFKANGADVKFAIHPVAGRMPGHMNVLLAEADVDYEELYEMDAINDQFKDTDLVLVVGANDVVNPAARFAEGTPIYGMPVLNVDEAKHVVICNYDLKPGYSGVDNPLYQQEERVTLLLGDAKESLNKLLNILS